MLKGLGGLGDMAGIMKQAQEMQGKIADAQAALENVEVTGESGAGMVTCIANAKGELKGLNIDASLFNPEDKEAVEDLILAAIKDVQIKAGEAMQAGMAEATAGMQLPEGMNFPGM